LTEPIVQQLMCRDQTDEATIRHLLQETAAARPTLRAKDDPNTDDPYSIGRLLQETARLWRLRCDREVRQIPGMTRARCAVLIQLAQHEGVNQAALAQILDIRSITLVRLLWRIRSNLAAARLSDEPPIRLGATAMRSRELANWHDRAAGGNGGWWNAKLAKSSP
jgi:hypothetical protein